jgi:ferric-dicitrate binding protein FerR (iron transport regulator)
VEQKNHINDTEKLLAETDNLHVSMEIPYEKTKEEIWEALQQKMAVEDNFVRPARPSGIRFWRIAATIALLVGLGALLRFYHHTIRTATGQLATITLPDNSIAMLNGQSALTYYPLWWKISPKIILSGEAFFKGHHTHRFSVESARGTVVVLGTSFDIYARNDNYRVVCFTGKVRVTSRTKNHIILTRGEKAEVSPQGEITFTKDLKPGNYNAWTNHQFVFTAVPIASVLAELARNYNVKIDLEKTVNEKYTGNFPANIPVEQALNIVCKPFGLTFVKVDRQHFVIK